MTKQLDDEKTLSLKNGLHNRFKGDATSLNEAVPVD